MEEGQVLTYLNPVLSISKDGTVLYSNDAGEPLLNEWDAKVGEKLPLSMIGYVQKVMSQNNPEKMEVKVGKKEYLVVFHPLPGLEFVNVSGFDISDRKKYEEELRESEDKYKGLFNLIEEGISIGELVLDKRGHPIDVITLDLNPAFEKHSGIRREQIIGRRITELFPVAEQIWLDRYYEVIRSGMGKHFEEYNASVERWFDVFASPMGCNRFITVFSDITRRRKTEEVLKKAHDNLEKLVEERTAQLERAFNSLKKSEEGLAEAQRMAHIGNWDWDLITGELYWSEEMYRIFERDPQEPLVAYTEFLNYIHPDDRDYVDITTKKALKGEPIDIDHRIILANGEERSVHTQSNVVFDDESRPIRLKGIFQDITEYKKAEEKIKNLANIVESSEDAIGTLTLEGNFISWNKGAEQVYGYPGEEIMGKPASTLASPHLDKETIKLIEKIKQGEKVMNYETLRLRKEGKTINVSITLSPVFDASGKLVAVSFITRDITKRKEAEEKLRESEEKYRNIVETANEGISIIDDKLRIIYVNKKIEDLTGYSAEEIIGKSVWFFICEKSRPIVKKNLENRWPDLNDSLEIEYTRKDGSPLWAHVNAKSLFDKEGKFMGIMTMLTDITRRKEVEEALANIEIARKKEIHHRIKNNLQVISSLLDLQADKFKNKACIRDSEVLEAFKESQNRVKSMALIHEELHKGERLETLNLSSYIEELTNNLLLTYRLGNYDICLNMELDQNVFFEMDIAIPLGIIINELVSNSLKHAFHDRNKGEIQVKLLKEEGSNTAYILSVSDNGIGIPEDLDIEEQNSLGLQLVTTLVEQLDGELELKRHNGTEFVIRFTVSSQASESTLQLFDNE